MAVQQVTVNSEDGACIGALSTDLVSFHGASPCDQAAALTCASTSVAVSVCGVFAFTSAQANALIASGQATPDANNYVAQFPWSNPPR